MTIETILNSDMSVAYITDCATSPDEKNPQTNSRRLLSNVFDEQKTI
jgi:hypothetical protein